MPVPTLSMSAAAISGLREHFRSGVGTPEQRALAQAISRGADLTDTQVEAIRYMADRDVVHPVVADLHGGTEAVEWLAELDFAEEATESIHDFHNIDDSLALEAVGDGSVRMKILRYGRSINGRNYTRPVMEAAAPLYEGAPAYDHHRTDEERRTSTVQGLAGYWSEVAATESSLMGTFTPLSSRSDISSALAASVEAVSAGRRPLLGASHDAVQRMRRTDPANPRHVDVLEVVHVNSVDLVASPSAGGGL